MQSCQDKDTGMMAVGVSEADPPWYPWRPLRAILARASGDDVHLWTSGSEDSPLHGMELPTEIFEARLAEGVVTRIDEPIPLPGNHVIARLADGRFMARPISEVRKDRHTFLVECLHEALSEIDSGQIARATERLDLARLAEDWHPMATVILGGVALEHREQDWAGPVIAELREIVPFLELDIIRQSLLWDALPQAERREDWLGKVLAFSSECRQPPALADLFPGDSSTLQASVLLLVSRELLGEEIRVLRSVAHRDLKRVVRAEPSAVGALVERVRVALGVSGPQVAFDELERRLDRLGKESVGVRNAIATRVKQADWERQAAALARVEATVGDATRYSAWRNAMARLYHANPRPDIEPWQAGEACARALSHFWGYHDEPPPRRLGEWARGAIGLAAPATSIDDPDIDGCHVVSLRAPPASFLDQARILARGTTTRFAIAKAFGFQALGAREPGTHLSHAPDPSGRQRPTTEMERAANGFAIYFIAPRAAVCALTRREELEKPQDYASAVEKVMMEFGITFSAAFPHVANCHRVPPPLDMWTDVSSIVNHQAVEQAWAEERLPVPSAGDGLDVPLERKDGFASLLARAVEEGRLPMETAERLLGGQPDRARAFLESCPSELR